MNQLPYPPLLIFPFARDLALINNELKLCWDLFLLHCQQYLLGKDLRWWCQSTILGPLPSMEFSWTHASKVSVTLDPNIATGLRVNLKSRWYKCKEHFREYQQQSPL